MYNKISGFIRVRHRHLSRHKNTIINPGFKAPFSQPDWYNISPPFGTFCLSYESLAYFEMILSSKGCRWALLCASAKAKYAKSCHLCSLARLQKPRLRPFRHNGAVGLMRLELARGFSCKRYRILAMR